MIQRVNTARVDCADFKRWKEVAGLSWQPVRFTSESAVDSANLRRSQLVYSVSVQPIWMPNYLDIKLNKTVIVFNQANSIQKQPPSKSPTN